ESHTPSFMPASPSVTIVIVNWDGKHLLEECLPSVIEAAGNSADILVVDNGSRDGSVELIKQQFPTVRILALDENYGFGGGNNRGAAAVQSDIVVFLNNDMIVDRNFLKPLLDCFSDSAVFAVASQVFFADALRRREETGNTRGHFEKGFIYLEHSPIDSSAPGPVLWAGGGSSAVDRQKLLEIRGFDGLYDPFYVEDLDVSYQAWKRGWKCIVAPASEVIHKHRGTSRPRFGNRFVDNTIRRNQYLFIWKNVTDFDMILEHLVRLPWIHGRSIRENGAAFEIQAFLRSVSRLPEALWRRISNRRYYVLSDREVFARIKN
ncbi:MAG: glycosyltransferase family 2 protein, partial [Acidobacteria bacterium]|nr:glycosyltransferase family 2 protein [Acidobacteriota bacterium]